MSCLSEHNDMEGEIYLGAFRGWGTYIAVDNRFTFQHADGIHIMHADSAFVSGNDCYIIYMENSQNILVTDQILCALQVDSCSGIIRNSQIFSIDVDCIRNQAFTITNVEASGIGVERGSVELSNCNATVLGFFNTTAFIHDNIVQELGVSDGAEATIERNTILESVSVIEGSNVNLINNTLWSDDDRAIPISVRSSQLNMSNNIISTEDSHELAVSLSGERR